MGTEWPPPFFNFLQEGADQPPQSPGAYFYFFRLFDPPYLKAFQVIYANSRCISFHRKPLHPPTAMIKASRRTIDTYVLEKKSRSPHEHLAFKRRVVFHSDVPCGALSFLLLPCYALFKITFHEVVVGVLLCAGTETHEMRPCGGLLLPRLPRTKEGLALVEIVGGITTEMIWSHTERDVAAWQCPVPPPSHQVWERAHDVNRTPGIKRHEMPTSVVILKEAHSPVDHKERGERCKGSSKPQASEGAPSVTPPVLFEGIIQIGIKVTAPTKPRHKGHQVYTRGEDSLYLCELPKECGSPEPATQQPLLGLDEVVTCKNVLAKTKQILKDGDASLVTSKHLELSSQNIRALFDSVGLPQVLASVAEQGNQALHEFVVGVARKAERAQCVKEFLNPVLIEHTRTVARATSWIKELVINTSRINVDYDKCRAVGDRVKALLSNLRQMSLLLRRRLIRWVESNSISRNAIGNQLKYGLRSGRVTGKDQRSQWIHIPDGQKDDEVTRGQHFQLGYVRQRNVEGA
eukprot:Gb_13516 [translate_table: standard]